MNGFIPLGVVFLVSVFWFFFMFANASMDPAPSQESYNFQMQVAFVIGVGSLIMMVGRGIYLILCKGFK